tara:strand:+ start:1117 stop:1293 length:177 start_codon:yes stop_codon:yes gene_type:complete
MEKCKTKTKWFILREEIFKTNLALSRKKPKRSMKKGELGVRKGDRYEVSGAYCSIYLQ